MSSTLARSRATRTPWSFILAGIAAVALFVGGESSAMADNLAASCGAVSIANDVTLSPNGVRVVVHRSPHVASRSACDGNADESCPIRRHRARRARRGCRGRSWRARWHRRHRRMGVKGQRLSIGFSKGALGTREDGQRRSQTALLGRMRLTPRLTAEVELGAAYEHHHRHRDGRRGRGDRGDNDTGDTRQPDGERDRDRHDFGPRDYFVGGGLLFHPMPRARFSPYLSVSAGAIDRALDDEGTRVNQRFGEFGVGLSVRIGRRLRLEGDVRTGRRVIDDDSKGALDLPIDGDEHYRRARFNAVFTF